MPALDSNKAWTAVGSPVASNLDDDPTVGTGVDPLAQGNPDSISNADVGQQTAGLTITKGDQLYGGLILYNATDTYNPDDGTGSKRLLIDPNGNLIFAAEAYPQSAFIAWADANATQLSKITTDYGSGHVTLKFYVIGRDSTDSGALWALIAQNYNATVTSSLQIESGGALYLTDPDAIQCDIETNYNRAFDGGDTVGNTTTETKIYEVTIKANALGSYGMISYDLGGDVTNASGGGIALTLRIKFGGTTVNTLKITVPNFAGTGGWYIHGVLGNGTTSAQRGYAMLVSSKNGSWDATSADYGTASKDTTSDQTFQITAQWASADATAVVSSKGGVLNLTRTNTT